MQTEILRRSNLHLRDSLASLESSNQSLTVSLKASTDDATKLAEEMAEVSGRRGEEWRERKEEIERKREMEEEVGELIVDSMSTRRIVNDRLFQPQTQLDFAPSKTPTCSCSATGRS